MTYELVYDAATAGYQAWMFPAIGLVLTAFGAALVFAPEFMNRLLPDGAQGTARGCFGWFFFLFALTWTIAATWFTISHFLDLRDASIRRDCREITGVVSHYVPQRGRSDGVRARPESFKVNGVRFEFQDNVFTGGFNRTAANGGPISDGVGVRICYVPRRAWASNIIVRLEVAE